MLLDLPRRKNNCQQLTFFSQRTNTRLFSNAHQIWNKEQSCQGFGVSSKASMDFGKFTQWFNSTLGLSHGYLAWSIWWTRRYLFTIYFLFTFYKVLSVVLIFTEHSPYLWVVVTITKSKFGVTRPNVACLLLLDIWIIFVQWSFTWSRFVC